MNIKFRVKNKETLNKFIDYPYPASKALPNWYKKLEARTKPENMSIEEFNHNPLGRTVKMCMPVFDMISAGYHIPLHVDTYFQNHPDGSGDIDIQWGEAFERLVEFHTKQQYSGYPVPEGYYDAVFKWITPWTVQTTPGWSCLFVPPSHYDELPFKCMSAFVDTDRYQHPVNLFFFLKKDFRGLVPRGTPLIQVIPIKREKVKSSIGFLTDKIKNNYSLYKGIELFNAYKKHLRSKKYYEEEKTESKCPFSL